MTYYQGIALEGAANLGFVDAGTGATAQNFLICIEMLLAALVHPFVVDPSFPFVYEKKLLLSFHLKNGRRTISPTM